MSKAYLSSLLILLLFIQCKNDGIDEINSKGTGTFTFAGKTFKGMCIGTPASGIGNHGIDVVISSSNVASDVFTIRNLPAATSGTSAFSDGWTQPSGTTYAIIAAENIMMATEPGGSVTKTGSKSFTFTCTVYSIVDNIKYTVTGSGTYE